MTSAVAKIIAKKILGETVANSFGREDPYFEQVPATRLDGKPSKKTKRRRKAIPPGLSDNDAKVLTKVKRRAYKLDNSLCNFCGIKFGWGSIIGIIPFIGDVLDMFMALMVFSTCRKIDGGMPDMLKYKMMFNILLDFGIGLVPFVGDIADAAFRCNTRNAVALESYLREKASKKRRTQGLPQVVDPSLPEEFDRLDEGVTDSPPEYHTNPTMSVQGATPLEPTPPAPARATTGASRKGAGWFSSGSRGQREQDLESGTAVAQTPKYSSSKRTPNT